METNKDFEKAIENLNKVYSPVIPNLAPFNVHLSTYQNKKKLFVELRKIWSVDIENIEDKNKLFLKKLLTISCSGKPIIAEISIEFKDAFRQKLKLQHQGLI